MPALRLLPVVILAAVCMLGLRIEVVVQNIADARKASLQVGGAPALAQTQPPAATAAPGPQVAAAEKPAEKAAEGQEAPKDGAETSSSFNPANLTKSEIETLQRLSERRTQIEKREQEVSTREAVMKAGEARIDGKVTQLQELEKTIQALTAKYDKQKQVEIDNLVKIYEAMKPREAAGIFDTLDMPILVSVAQNMKTAKVAPIMAVMNKEKARLLTEELSQKKQIGSAN